MNDINTYEVSLIGSMVINSSSTFNKALNFDLQIKATEFKFPNRPPYFENQPQDYKIYVN